MRTVLSILVAAGTLAASEAMAQAPISVGQNDREFRPPREAGQVSRSTPAQVRDQTQRQDRRDPRNARAQQRVVAPDAFDGSWSVAIITRSGACEPSYRFRVEIIDGDVVYEGQPAGQVSRNGGVYVNISQGGQQAAGQGRLSRDHGTGVWRGNGTAGNCAGVWQAERRD
jgi:hypothetical protein